MSTVDDRATLVLGGSGFVGRHLVARLVSAGRRVIIPTRQRERARHLILLPTVDVVEADIHDEAALARLVRRASVVVNLVGILNERRRGEFERVHVELTRKVVAACGVAGVSRLLHMSALNADPQGPSRYLRTKGEAEIIVASSDLAWTIFRPSVIFGREDSFLNLFAKLERMMPLGIFSIPKTSTVSYCPARIAAAASPRAAPPLAQPASTSTIGIPVRASAPSTLCPDATPP
jgi:NADH dehydrogenase